MDAIIDPRRAYQAALDEYHTAVRERRQRLITSEEFQNTKREMTEAKARLEAAVGPVNY